MANDIYRVPIDASGQIFIVGRPRGGDWLRDDVERWKRAGIETAVSLLTPDEERDLNLEHEGDEVRRAEMEYRSFPVSDRSVPLNNLEYLNLLKELADQVRAGRSIAVHCRMSIGRAPMLVAGILVNLGATPETAIEAISNARGVRVPETIDQRRWIDTYAIDFGTAAS